MATTTPVSTAKPLVSPAPVPITPELWEHVERVVLNIFKGELVVIFSGIAAIVGMGLLGAAIYVSTSFSAPAIALLVISAVSGPFGQAMIDNATAEKNDLMRGVPPKAATHVFETDQPIGLSNEGNTCFINSTFQMILNDAVLCGAIKESFAKEIVRHKAFNTLIEWIKGDADELTDTSLIPEALVFFTLDRSSLLEVKTGADQPLLPNAQYPLIRAAIGAFQQAIIDNGDFPQVDVGALKAEFELLKKDAKLKEYIVSQKPVIDRRLKGFTAFIEGEAAYRQAEAEQTAVVPTKGGSWWYTGSLLRDLRGLMPQENSYSQEDAAEFLQSVLNWVPGYKYPNLFVAKGTERQWQAYVPTDPTDAEVKRLRLEDKREKTVKSRNPNEQLTQLPDSNLTKTIDGYACVLKIDYPLVEGALGQELLDQTLKFHAHPHVGDPIAYAQGWFQLAAERVTLEPHPQRIVVELKRFEKDPDLKKIDANVHMPEQTEIDGQKYRLKSIVLHSGWIHGGHYISYINKNGSWWYISDSSVSKTADITRGLDQGYLYFYEKV